jgi:hypothetical protein
MNTLKKQKYLKNILEMQAEIVSENMVGFEHLTNKTDSVILDHSKTTEEYGRNEMQFKKGEW